MNPYRGTTLLGFFVELGGRLWGFVTGRLGVQDLASDELQLLVLGSIAISGALVGTMLLLRRMAMLANSLSHTALLGIVIAYLIAHGHGSSGLLEGPSVGMLTLAALITALITTFFTELLTRRLQEDAAIGVVFSTLFALGLLLVTLYTRNLHIGTEVVMGNADALHPADLRLAGATLAANLGATLLLRRFYATTSFDPGFSRSIGFSPSLGHYLLMLQVATTVVAGFRAVGVMMVLAFMVATPLAARQLTNRLGRLLLLASLLGLLATFLGVATARHLLSVYQLAFSTAGLVVCYLILLFALTLLPRLWHAYVRRVQNEPFESKLNQTQHEQPR
jgi:manganese/zinc/iron transport system permease protein